MSTEHKHGWRSTMHLDGCHFYSTSYSCACGATASREDERSPIADPYSMVWMEPAWVEVNRDERGRFVKPHMEEAKCARCEQLQAGAPTRHSLLIVAKDGTVEREETSEHEQKPEPEEDEE